VDGIQKTGLPVLAMAGLAAIALGGIAFSAPQTSKDLPGATDPTLVIPAVQEKLAIDSSLGDPAWQSAITLPLRPVADTGDGGSTRIAVKGHYLCLSARLPEKGRLVARSTGPNPTWWQEDMLVWMIRYRSPVTDLNVTMSLAVNPLGAYSLWGASGGGTSNARAYPLDNAGAPLAWAGEMLIATGIGADGWTVETALPMEQIGRVGFISVERIRAARPDAPTAHWYWPGANERMDFLLPAPSSNDNPTHNPPPLPKNVAATTPPKPSGEAARELGNLSGRVWSELQHSELTPEQQLEKSIRARMAKQAEREKIAWQAVTTLKEWEQFRDERLAALRSSLGPFPDKTPLRPAVTRRIHLGEGFVIENVVFESRPGLLVTANLYLPESPAGRIPAVVAVHSHHAAKTQSELQDLGMTWAKAGTAVLIMDQLCAGERIQSQPWPREGYFGRYALGNQLYLAGESLMKWIVWDITRGIDFLNQRPEIDPKRIVLLGACAGGGDPAALTALLDPRVAAVIPMNFGEAGPEEHYTEGPRPYDPQTADPGWGYWETTRNLRQSVAGQFFPWFICAAVAPRPFAYAIEMGWPKTVEEEPAWARYQKVFELYRLRDRLAEIHGFGPFPGPGEFTNFSTFFRKRLDPILHRWLGMPIPRIEFHNLLPEASLMALNWAAKATFEPKPASSEAFRLARLRLEASRTRMAELPRNEQIQLLKAELRKQLGDIEPADRPEVRSLWSRQHPNFVMDAFAITSESGITLPVILLTPKEGTVKHPAVLALAQGGKTGFLKWRANGIAALLAQGVAVCLPDLRGDGELSGNESRGPESMTLAANELMLGGTPVGARLKDARTIFRWLLQRPDIDPARIGIWGDSFAPVNAADFQLDQSPGQLPGPIAQNQAEPLGSFLALLTALYEGKASAVAASGGLTSFLSVLQDRFCQIPQDVIVPGLLEVADLRDIVGALGDRPVLLEGLVDGLNKALPLSDLQKEFGAGNPSLVLRESSASPSLPAWIATQCTRQR